MHFVLIVLILSAGTSNTNGFSAEFESQAACKNAALALVAAANLDGFKVASYCLPKGDVGRSEVVPRKQHQPGPQPQKQRLQGVHTTKEM